jgi:hypothetical protein
MKHALLLFLFPVLALATSACSGDDGGGGGGAGGGGGGGAGGSLACSNSGSKLMAAAANNYSFASTLTFPAVKVKPMSELTFDWSAVTKDFMGHGLDPKKDLNLITVLFWKMPLDQLQTNLNDDTLAMRNLATPPLAFFPEGNTTSAKLFSMKLINGQEVEAELIKSYFDADFYTPTSDYTYTLMAATGTEVGQGVRMIKSFQLDPGSTNTEVKMDSDSTKLDWSANLHDLTPTGIPVGQANLTLDWGSIAKNSLGKEFIASNITRAIIGRYNESVTQLEAKFLDIEIIATEFYVKDIESGTTVELSSLETVDGKAFSGIDSSGTWLVALQCGGCRNPAPWYLSVLKPCQ